MHTRPTTFRLDRRVMLLRLTFDRRRKETSSRSTCTTCTSFCTCSSWTPHHCTHPCHSIILQHYFDVHTQASFPHRWSSTTTPCCMQNQTAPKLFAAFCIPDLLCIYIYPFALAVSLHVAAQWVHACNYGIVYYFCYWYLWQFKQYSLDLLNVHHYFFNVESKHFLFPCLSMGVALFVLCGSCPWAWTSLV